MKLWCYFQCQINTFFLLTVLSITKLPTILLISMDLCVFLVRILLRKQMMTMMMIMMANKLLVSFQPQGYHVMKLMKELLSHMTGIVPVLYSVWNAFLAIFIAVKGFSDCIGWLWVSFLYFLFIPFLWVELGIVQLTLSLGT